MDLYALQQKEFMLLQILDHVCCEHQLQYSLAWGSALGAVRHHGFIPWDDDIDVMMPWNDFIKFFEIMKNYNNDNIYAENSLESEITCVFQGRIGFLNTTNMSKQDQGVLTNVGICIDIFPLFPMDSMESYANQKKMYNRVCAYAIKAYHYQKSGDLKTDFIRFLFRHTPNKWLNKLAKKEIKAMLQTRQDFKYYIDFGDEGNIFDKALFHSYIDIEFENQKFKILVGYDTYLQQLYGDYMKLPNEADRVQHSQNQIIDTTKGFAFYRESKT